MRGAAQVSHSRPIVDTRYPNASADQHLGGLLCIRKQVKTVNRKDVPCFVFRHDDFEGQELHCVCRWSTGKEEGPSGELFDVERTVTVQTVQEDEEAEMPEYLLYGQGGSSGQWLLCAEMDN
jgi:hypothetical protein